MASKINRAKPTNNYVLLRVEEVDVEPYDKRESGILVPNSEDGGASSGKSGKKHKVFVEDVGPDVNLEEKGFNIGDEVVFNEYDAKTFGDDNQTYVLIQEHNIMASIETE